MFRPTGSRLLLLAFLLSLALPACSEAPGVDGEEIDDDDDTPATPALGGCGSSLAGPGGAVAWFLLLLPFLVRLRRRPSEGA